MNANRKIYYYVYKAIRSSPNLTAGVEEIRRSIDQGKPISVYEDYNDAIDTASNFSFDDAVATVLKIEYNGSDVAKIYDRRNCVYEVILPRFLKIIKKDKKAKFRRFKGALRNYWYNFKDFIIEKWRNNCFKYKVYDICSVKKPSCISDYKQFINNICSEAEKVSNRTVKSIVVSEDIEATLDEIVNNCDYSRICKLKKSYLSYYKKRYKYGDAKYRGMILIKIYVDRYFDFGRYDVNIKRGVVHGELKL